jgi:hypothetical protein
MLWIDLAIVPNLLLIYLLLPAEISRCIEVIYHDVSVGLIS